MSLTSTSLFAFLSRDWQLYSVRLWGWLQWHNESSYPFFLRFWSTVSSLLRREVEEYNNCCVVDGSPPPPTEGEVYTYQISLGVTEEGLCCHLLGRCTWKRTLGPFIPAPGTSLPTSDSKGMPQQWIFSSSYFLDLNNVIAEGWAKHAVFLWVRQSCTAAFYVQYLPAAVTLLKALGSLSVCFSPGRDAHTQISPFTLNTFQLEMQLFSTSIFGLNFFLLSSI